jgi:D-alanyl-D-alanine carboxypeptidase
VREALRARRSLPPAGRRRARGARRHAGRTGSAVAALALIAAASIALPASSASAQARAVATTPRVSAEAVLLLDLGTGKVLYEKNPEENRAPASLVKLMTLYVTYSAVRSGRVALSDPVVVSPNAMRTARFRMGLVAGQVVALDTLLAAVAIASANDAATAVAEHVAGTEEAFVQRMNDEAERMGLTQTVFVNPHGLPDPRGRLQRTTARDMAVLAEHLLQDFPESRQLLGETEFAWRGRLFRRRIPLFRDPGGVTALKTGFTLEAGYNIAVAAARTGQRLLCVVLGAETRGLSFVDARRLLKFGFGDSISPAGHGGPRWRLRGRTGRSGGR